MQVGKGCLLFWGEIVREVFSKDPEQGAAVVTGGGVLQERGGESVVPRAGAGEQAGCELAKGVVAGAFRGRGRSHLGVRRVFWVREVRVRES